MSYHVHFFLGKGIAQTEECLSTPTQWRSSRKYQMRNVECVTVEIVFQARVGMDSR